MSTPVVTKMGYPSRCTPPQRPAIENARKPPKLLVDDLPFKKFGIPICQGFEPKKGYFLYLKNFPDERFAYSGRPIVPKDFKDPRGYVCQELNRIKKPQILIDLSPFPQIKPIGVLSAMANFGLQNIRLNFPEMSGAAWKNGQYDKTKNGGKFGLPNTHEGGYFLAILLINSLGNSLNPELTGGMQLKDLQPKILYNLENAGASPHFYKGFNEGLTGRLKYGAGAALATFLAGMTPRQTSGVRGAKTNNHLRRRPNMPEDPPNGGHEPPPNPMIRFSNLPPSLR